MNFYKVWMILYWFFHVLKWIIPLIYQIYIKRITKKINKWFVKIESIKKLFFFVSMKESLHIWLIPVPDHFQDFLRVRHVLRKVFHLHFEFLLVLLVLNLSLFFNHLFLLLQLFIHLLFVVLLMMGHSSREQFLQHALLLLSGHCCARRSRRWSITVKEGDLVFDGQLWVFFVLVGWPQTEVLFESFEQRLDGLSGHRVNLLGNSIFLVLQSLVIRPLQWEVLPEQFWLNEGQPHFPVCVHDAPEHKVNHVRDGHCCQEVNYVKRERLLFSGSGRIFL